MPKRAPFFRHILGGYIAITIAFLVVGSFIGIFAFQRYARIVQVRELARTTESEVIAIEKIYTQKNTAQLSALVMQNAQRLKLRLTVIDSNGLVIADSEKDPGLLLNHIARPEIQAALNGRPGSDTRLSESVHKELVYVAVPIMQKGIVIGVVRTSVGVHDMRAYVQPFIVVLLLCGLVFVVLVGVYAIALSRSLAEPLDELAQAAAAMAVGTLATRVHLRSPLFKSIGGAFNTMAGRLEKTISQIQKQKEDLAVLIEALPAGVLVVDDQGQVLIVNSQAASLFAFTPRVGGAVWEFCRDSSVNELIQSAQQGVFRAQDITLSAKVFHVVSRKTPTGVLLLFNDVTAVRALAEMKRDFVVNASHELRTPLTAIKGFSENLMDELTGDTKHYAEIIYKNTERLINIVQDIMTLSELENASDVVKKEQINIRALLDDLVVLFSEKARGKKIELLLAGDTDVIVAGDQFKLQQVFINLIDNAIKYTDQGTVTVTLTRDAGQIAVAVKDSGIGIAPEHLSRLFERFYVVDRSRSRKTGGTGLGLSIVKHIVLLHNGSIDVASTPGQSTTFTVKLPI